MKITAKQRYFDKKYKSAAMIKCECGCGAEIKSVDKYARPVRYLNGHNRRKYYGSDSTSFAREKRWRDKNKNHMRQNKKLFYRKRKLLAMEIAGNKCHFCGVAYNGKNAPIFEFHHTNPKEKENGVTRILINKAWKSTISELKKCVLTCANCHNQHHGGEW